MNLSVLIVEDNPDDAAQLMACIKKVPYLITAKAVETTNDALAGLLQNAYDLVFLDLEMQDTNGMDLLQSMPMPPTIIVSAHPAYAVNSFDIDSVVDFIQKPVTFPRLLRALKRANKKLTPAEKSHLFLKVGRQMQRFEVNDISYIEADAIYSKVFLRDGSSVLVNDNISEVEKKTVGTRLLRLQKSYIFNLDHVSSFDSRTLTIGDMKFQVGVQYRGKLFQMLNLEHTTE